LRCRGLVDGEPSGLGAAIKVGGEDMGDGGSGTMVVVIVVEAGGVYMPVWIEQGQGLLENKKNCRVHWKRAETRPRWGKLGELL
jgi:hypothetical protein